MRKIVIGIIFSIFCGLNLFGGDYKLGVETYQKNDYLKKLYYDNGNLEYESTWTNGALNGLHKRYYKNGKLEYETEYINGKRNGIYKKYYENGNLMIKGSYNNDEFEGAWNGYYKSGKLKFEKNYNDGILNGVYKKYYESGELFLEIFIANNSIINGYMYSQDGKKEMLDKDTLKDMYFYIKIHENF